MNRLRFGALVLMRGRRLGFYLSHRVVLTVPKPGSIRAAAISAFQPSQVFATEGVAVPFFEAMSSAVNCDKKFPSSFDMVKHMLSLPAEMRLNDFIEWMRLRYCAELIDFVVPQLHCKNEQHESRLGKATEFL